MLNRKMIIAVLITLFGLLALLYSNPEVSGFFSGLNEQLGNILPIERVVTRNVSFHLESNKYNDLEFSLKDGNITIRAEEINVNMLGSKISVKDSFDIQGFSGRGEIKNGSVYLNGKAENVSFAGAAIFGKTDIELNSTFVLLEIGELSLNELKLYSIDGSLKARNLEITLSSEDVEVKDPKGRFIFNGGLKIDGIANRISTSSKLLLES